MAASYASGAMFDNAGRFTAEHATRAEWGEGATGGEELWRSYFYGTFRDIVGLLGASSFGVRGHEVWKSCFYGTFRDIVGLLGASSFGVRGHEMMRGWFL